MAGLIPQSFIDDLLNRSDIVEVVGSRIQLKKTGKNFRVPVLAAAIGIYLPLELMVPIFLGGLIAHFVERFHGLRAGDEEARDRIHRPGTLYALDRNDAHVLRATKGDLRLVCVFNPPLSGNERHREDGSYAPEE